MQIKHFSTLVLLLAFNALLASPISTGLNTASVWEERVQVFPAPTNFHILVSTPTSHLFAWDTPPSPRAHRIRVYRTLDGVLLNTTDVPAGTDMILIGGLPLNTTVDAEIRAVDENGEEGEPAFIEATDGIILDLVVKGRYIDQTGPLGCTIYTSGYLQGSACEFSTAGTGFIIMPQFPFSLPSRKFYIQEYSPTYLSVAPDLTLNPAIKIYCSYGNDLTYCTNTPHIVIKGPTPGNPIPTVIAKIDVIYSDGGYYLKALALNSAYVIKKILNPRPETTQRDGDAEMTASAQPNPFSETLDVLLPTQAENIQLQLFNLAGQKVLDQQFTGGQAQYSLSTVALSPGFYLLRIEADGQVQTLKVVKSE